MAANSSAVSQIRSPAAPAPTRAQLRSDTPVQYREQSSARTRVTVAAEANILVLLVGRMVQHQLGEQWHRIIQRHGVGSRIRVDQGEFASVGS
jgi:hypothetical protein